MGALVGLGVGLGLLLVWWGITDDSPPRPRQRRRDTLARRAGVEGVTTAGLAVLCASAGVVTGLLLLAVSRTWSVAALFALMAAYAPVATLRARAVRRRRELGEVWPEAVDNLASAVRAGMSLPEALMALAERGPEPLRDPFDRFARDYQASGRFGDSLDLLKQRLADPVGDRVVEAVRLARQVGGGDLGRVLRALSTFLRDDLRTRAELEARQSWTVNGARLAVAAPWLVLLLLSFQGEVIQRYASTTGTIILVGGAVSCVVAYRLMVRIGRLPVERRVLA